MKRTLSEIKLPPLYETSTSSGMTVLVARRGPLPLVALRLTVLGGSSTDPKGKEGLADFTVGLCRRGTQKLTADELDERVEFVGASLFIGASEDAVTFGISAPAEHAAAMIDVLARLAQEPSFPHGEVEAARERTLAQLANDLDDPSTIADRALVKAIWGDHPYGHDVSGSARSVSSFTRDDVLAYHRDHLGPKVATLLAVGAVDPEAIAQAVEKSFGRWRGGPEASPIIAAPERVALAGKVVLVDKPEQTQSQVRAASMSFPKSHPDFLGAQVVNAIFGGGFTSRLVDEIRVNRGLSYGASSYFDVSRAGGSFQISTFTKTQTTKEILDVALGEAKKLRQRGPTLAELDKAKTYLCGLYPLRLETNESLAGAIADVRMHGLGEEYLQTYRGRVMAVQPKVASALAGRWFLPDAERTMVIVGRAAEVKRQVEKFGQVELWKPADVG